MDHHPPTACHSPVRTDKLLPGPGIILSRSLVYTVLAPSDGTVTELALVHPGSVLDASRPAVILVQKIDLDRIEVAVETADEDMIALDEAIDSLADQDQVCADLVKLRFFAGLTLRDAATSLGIPGRTADRHWSYAQAWLYDQLRDD